MRQTPYLRSTECGRPHKRQRVYARVENFGSRGYADFAGLILNRRNVKNEEAKVAELAEDIHSSVVGALDRSDLVLEAEELGKTVVEAFPDSDMARQYRTLADAVLTAAGGLS